MRWPHLIPRLWKKSLPASSHPDAEPADYTPDTPELAPHLALGRRGELLAAQHLKQNGYHLVASNFKINVGRNRRGALLQAEIDLIAYDAQTLCFIEVKTRTSDWYASPEANVDLRKQRQITRAARAYRRAFNLLHTPYRYDVLAVILPTPDPSNGNSPPPRLQLLKNFWTDDKFRHLRHPDTAWD